MMPVLVTFGAIRNTWPPDGVVMAPWLTTSPATLPAVKLFFPARKSAFDIFSVDATRPATLTCEPAPNTMPFGLIRNTRPFDCRAPRIWVGSPPVTRLSTLLELLCWMNFTISPAEMEKLVQLMIAFGLLVIVKIFPCRENVTLP